MMKTKEEIKKPFVREPHSTKMSRSITYAVHGFWSRHDVSVRQSKHWETGEWEQPDISWGSGGRDPKQEPDEDVAAECFAKAILDAVKVARKWSKATPPTNTKDES